MCFSQVVLLTGGNEKYIVLISGLFLLNLTLKAQEDTIIQRIVLIGDAGQLTNGIHPVVDAVRNNIKLDKKLLLYISETTFTKLDYRMTSQQLIKHQELYLIHNFL